MRTKEEILELLKDNGASTREEMMGALEHGELLAKLGISDDDQETIEELYSELRYGSTNTKMAARRERGSWEFLAQWCAAMLEEGEDLPPPFRQFVVDLLEGKVGSPSCIIVGLTDKGKETAVGYWQRLAKSELVNPEGLFSEIIERCADTWSWDHPEQGADWELSSFDSKSGNPELCTFMVSDFVFEEVQ